jgi:EAL domain-containing protein (putative c-di-GMP-specific phosphodiesterase class I)
MGKRTIAEFVESSEILAALREIGVDYAQGYAIGKPAPFETMYPLPANAHREVA